MPAAMSSAVPLTGASRTTGPAVDAFFRVSSVDTVPVVCDTKTAPGLALTMKPSAPKPVSRSCSSENRHEMRTSLLRQIGNRFGHPGALRLQSVAEIVAPCVDRHVVTGVEQPTHHRFSELACAEESNDVGHVFSYASTGSPTGTTVGTQVAMRS